MNDMNDDPVVVFGLIFILLKKMRRLLQVINMVRLFRLLFFIFKAIYEGFSGGCEL